MSNYPRLAALVGVLAVACGGSADTGIGQTGTGASGNGGGGSGVGGAGSGGATAAGGAGMGGSTATGGTGGAAGKAGTAGKGGAGAGGGKTFCTPHPPDCPSTPQAFMNGWCDNTPATCSYGDTTCFCVTGDPLMCHWVSKCSNSGGNGGSVGTGGGLSAGGGGVSGAGTGAAAGDAGNGGGAGGSSGASGAAGATGGAPMACPIANPGASDDACQGCPGTACTAGAECESSFESLGPTTSQCACSSGSFLCCRAGGVNPNCDTTQLAPQCSTMSGATCVACCAAAMPSAKVPFATAFRPCLCGATVCGPDCATDGDLCGANGDLPTTDSCAACARDALASDQCVSPAGMFAGAAGRAMRSCVVHCK